MVEGEMELVQDAPFDSEHLKMNTLIEPADKKWIPVICCKQDANTYFPSL
jgi:hypothetical protein